ncbi:MAG TPA: hypothetical protein VHO68_07785, partial [Bacteroidales bacterium]|nr:hypothetical protein [Bacteroidales bacterium]
ASVIKEILKGKLSGPKRDIVILNSAFALSASGITSSPKDGIQVAKDIIDSGKAFKKLEDLIEISNS